MDVARTAIRLATNPLGIIALFLVVAYGIAAFVLRAGGAPLPEESQRLLVWFIVLFPVFMLADFSLLVIFWHTHLYAPMDFPDASGFSELALRLAGAPPLPSAVQRQRLASEVEEEAAATAASSNVPASDEAGSKDDAQSASPNAPPHSATGTSTNVAVSDEASTKGYDPSANMNALLGTVRPGVIANHRRRVFLAEELATRKLETEWNVRISRQVTIDDQVVGGAVLVGTELRVIEIKYSNTNGQRLAEDAAKKLASVLREPRMPTDRTKVTDRTTRRGYIVVVLGDANPKTAMMWKRITEALRASPRYDGIECIVFSFRALAEEFGVEA